MRGNAQVDLVWFDVDAGSREGGVFVQSTARAALASPRVLIGLSPVPPATWRRHVARLAGRSVLIGLRFGFFLLYWIGARL